MCIRDSSQGHYLAEKTGLAKDGQHYHVEIRGSRFRFQNSDHLLAIVNDITEQKLAQMALRAAHDELEGRVRDRTAELEHVNVQLKTVNEKLVAARDHAIDASKAKSAFLANMSHELRTPLNAIIGYSEMLLDDADARGDAEMVDDLRKIGVSGVHLLELINNILDLTKIEAGRMELWPERFSARALIQSVVGTLETLAERRGDRLEIRIPREIGFMYTDMLKLRQVLFNLLGNAIKFTENGVIRVSGRRETVEDRDWIEISVADSGIGIDAAALPRLFKDFTQADPSTTRRYGGAGLGLSIAREFSRLMGGEVSATSVPGEGSTFTVWLPAELELSQLARPSAPAPELGPVLVLDDDPATSEQIQRALQGLSLIHI